MKTFNEFINEGKKSMMDKYDALKTKKERVKFLMKKVGGVSEKEAHEIATKKAKDLPNEIKSDMKSQ